MQACLPGRSPKAAAKASSMRPAFGVLQGPYKGYGRMRFRVWGLRFRVLQGLEKKKRSRCILKFRR